MLRRSRERQGEPEPLTNKLTNYGVDKGGSQPTTVDSSVLLNDFHGPL